MNESVNGSRGAPYTTLTLSETLSLIQRAPSNACSICVVIPARDEADSIQCTLLALARQRDLAGNPIALESYEVILLANNCRDGTASSGTAGL